MLYAAGHNFTAPVDLPEMAPLIRMGKLIIPDEYVDPFNSRPAFRQTPLVVAVQGYCYTLGIEAMLAADIATAADPRFSELEVKRGIMATGGATIRMVERSGWGNAMRYLVTGEEFDAETALRLNFVQEIVELGEQLNRALEIAQQISGQAPLVVRQTIISARLAVDEGSAAAVALCKDI
ncbi:MAG: Short-chain-enoyl-CoA hydratase [Alphaproteobacteria bacterium MarineAlpha9_Bin5]|nr:MAG: Short-chain-enoyl-CoA hydratase [Alphaproteobacteria bacterium MarineAlpha9_Bin5]